MSKKLYIKTSHGTRGSQSAKRLAQVLGEKLGYKVFRSIKDFPKKQALTYGQGVDKLAQFLFFQNSGIPSLEFTTSQAKAAEWLNGEQAVFGRRLLSSSCGKGIEVYEPTAEGQIKLMDGVPCPVYTLYKKKKREFRVHVFKDTVVRVVEKKLRKDWDGPRESKIRNLANGFVFCHCEDEPEGLRELAVRAGACVSSVFRGVDIGYNAKHNELFVIEVNSAPGMEGSTLGAYANAIISGVNNG